jgi:hypothetical protein
MQSPKLSRAAEVDSTEKAGPKILFEARWFHKFSAGIYDCSHPHLSQPTWEGARKYYRDDQWVRLLAASTLDMEAALKSASWGKFQVMGFNHNGFRNVFDFCNAMFLSETEHLRCFLAYCKDNILIPHLKQKEWSRFAEKYNGTGYKKNSYDIKLEKAYEEYKKREMEIKIWV